MDTAQWPQEIVVKPMEEIIVPNTCSSSVTAATNNILSNNNNSNNCNNKTPSTSLERKVRPQKDQALHCPRCNSTNTKFCYYNNYSLTQPRYFCKTCRRYWTEGGSLRNIPVGGGSRKNKRSSSTSTSSSSSSASKKLSHEHLMATPQSHLLNPNPKIHHHQGQDLNLGFPPTHHHQEFRSLSEFIQLPTIENTPKSQIPNNSDTDATTTGAASTTADANQHHHHHHLSAMELLNGLTSRGLTPFMPMPVPDPNAVYSSGYPSLQDFKPNLNFSLDGLGNGYGSLQGGGVQQQETNHGRLLFPFEDLKQVSSNNNSGDHNNSTTNEQTREQGDSTGYWTGMLGTGGSW